MAYVTRSPYTQQSLICKYYAQSYVYVKMVSPIYVSMASTIDCGSEKKIETN